MLLDPPFKATTYALWFGPVFILLFAFLIARSSFKSRPDTEEDADIDFLEKEKKRIAKALEEEQEDEE